MNQTIIADFHNIHYFKAPDCFILLDVNTGNIFRIDQPTVEVLEELKLAAGNWEQAKAKLKGESGEILAALGELTAAGELFAPDAYAGKYQPPPAVLKSLCLNICHDCDLRCRYCFASTGSFGGKRQAMDFATGAKALDYLLTHSGKRKFLEVDFFGGEPLLNLEVIKELVAYGTTKQQEFGKVLRFTLTTNCMTLDDQITDWAVANNVSIVLSHDGRPEVHDRMRPLPDGGGSYQTITQNIQRYLARDPRQTAIVRGTYTAYNRDFTEDIKHWLDLGFERLSMEPAVELYGDRALKPEHLPELAEEYWRLAELYRQAKEEGRGFNFFHFNLDVDHGPCLPKRLTGCGAGYEYLVVTPEGDLYPCHQFVGREGYCLGHVDTGIAPGQAELVEKFRQSHVYSKPACSKCWARFYCSGGCHANADLFNHDLYQPYEMGCELARIRTECGLWQAIQDR